MLKKTILVATLAVLSLSVWLGTRVLDAASSNPRAMKSEFPYKIRQALDRMDLEIKGARHLVHAHSRRIGFIDRDGSLREYCFVHNMLWRDGYPLVSGVEAFHFEYRDERGSLFIRSDLHRTDVRRIGYSIRMTSDDGDVVQNKTVRVCPGDFELEPEQRRVVWAGLSD